VVYDGAKSADARDTFEDAAVLESIIVLTAASIESVR
jgi:hypothetical protein